MPHHVPEAPGDRTPSEPGRLPSPHQVVPTDFRYPSTAEAAIFRAVLLDGPISREDVCTATGIGLSTVNRRISDLLEIGLLRERPGLASPNAIGRPRRPLDLNHQPYLTVGVHIGAVVTGIVVCDLRGRMLAAVQIPTPESAQAKAVDAIAGSARSLISAWPGRRPLWLGVAIGGRVDPVTGVVDHERLNWHHAKVGAIFASVLDLPVSVAPHVDAMAAAELLLPIRAARVNGAAGTHMYIYARETVGFALTIDGDVHMPRGGPGSIAHLPTGSDAECTCGRRGCLDATVADSALVERAIRLGLLTAADSPANIGVLYQLADTGSAAARRLLIERAEVLGRSIALLHDMVNADYVILGGHAFTGWPAALPRVADSFAQTSMIGRKQLSLTRFGDRVQVAAACATSLSAIYADPMGAMRRATR